MIYLKFVGTGTEQPIMEKTVETKEFSVAPAPDGVRIYHSDGLHEEVSSHAWLNCFVMSDSGKTIGKYDASNYQ